MAAWRVLVVTAVVGLGVAACGGDDEPASPKEAFLDAGNDICEDRAFKVPEPKSSGEVIANLRRATRAIDDSIEKLRDLTPPPGDEEEVEEIFAAMDEEVELSTEFLDLAERGQESDSLKADLDDATAEASRLSEAYGLDECAAQDE